MDFIGVQNYTREFVSYAPLMPFVRAKIIKASKRNVEHTLMDWEVYPPSIYNALKRLQGYGTINEIIITENGAAFNDSYEEDKVDDYKRVKFLQDYIAQVLLAKREGVKVNGYFIWTLLDNFEWAEGYYPKFGMVHVDFETQRRVIKNSGNWYSRFLQDTLAVSKENWESGIQVML